MVKPKLKGGNCITCNKSLLYYETYLLSKFNRKTKQYDIVLIYCDKHYPKK